MTPSGSTFRAASKIVALAVWALVGAGCLVNDTDLPCRGDCECPSGQFCGTAGRCKPGSSRLQKGDTDGRCLDDGTCGGTLVCLKDDVCGELMCRQRCSRVPGLSNGCPTGHVCQDVHTGEDDPPPFDVTDGGILIGEGVCVP